MPLHGVQQRAHSATCSYPPVIPQPEDKPVLVHDDEHGRVWTVTRTVHCTAERHDTVSAYKNLGCRCPQATARTVDYQRRRDNGQILPSQPATLTMRQLQALAVIGWPADAIAPLAGRNPVSLSEIRRGRHDMVTGRTAAAVKRIYRRLHNQPGPSDRTRAYAARQGWAGPSVLLLYGATDEVKIARAIAGEPVELSRAERLTAVRVLREANISYPQIATRLNVHERQVHRDLVDLDLVNRDNTLEETG